MGRLNVPKLIDRSTAIIASGTDCVDGGMKRIFFPATLALVQTSGEINKSIIQAGNYILYTRLHCILHTENDTTAD